MTNKASLLAQAIQCLSSTVMAMMFLKSPYIDDSVAVMYTAKGYAVAKRIIDCCLSSFGSKDICGEFRSSVSQDSSQSISFPRYVATSLKVLYFAGAGVVPKGKSGQRKSSLSTIDMHVYAVVAFACIRR